MSTSPEVPDYDEPDGANSDTSSDHHDGDNGDGDEDHGDGDDGDGGNDEGHLVYHTLESLFYHLIIEDRTDRFPQVIFVGDVFHEAADSENGDSEESEQSFDSQPERFVAASNSSIEGLEKVRVEGDSEKCTVCLGDMEIGSEATRMPCSHVYHCDCIKTWLTNSRLCPICRFSMPCD